MKEAKHTKGKARVVCRIFDYPRIFVGNREIAKVMGNLQAEAHEINAERLVLCWNSHDALLEACKGTGKENKPEAATK